MRSLMFAGALALASTDVSAQAIYKCVTKGKPVSFQSHPCPANAKVAAIREYKPQPDVIRPRGLPTTPQSRPRHYTSTTTVINDAAKALGYTCAQAKADRDTWERAVGLSRTYDAIRAWNQTVARACN